MKARYKILLTVGAAVLAYWLWSTYNPPEEIEGITESTCPGVLDSPIATASQAPAYTVAGLRALYNSDNSEFFGGRLPDDVVVDYNVTEPRYEATTSKWSDGRFHVSFNPVYATSSKHVGYLMLHESCHVKLWDETHPPDQTPFPDGTGKDDHGKLWQSCMLGIDASGGFRRLLIDSYGGK